MNEFNRELYDQLTDGNNWNANAPQERESHFSYPERKSIILKIFTDELIDNLAVS